MIDRGGRLILVVRRQSKWPRSHVQHRPTRPRHQHWLPPLTPTGRCCIVSPRLINETAMKTIGAWSPLISFLLGAAFTGLVLAIGFDPDRNTTPVLWMCVPGMLVAVAQLRPVLASVIAGIAAFPIVLFAYLALTSGPGNIWPIAMGIHAVIASLPFGFGYGIGMLLNLLVRSWRDNDKH
jgi:hypothetical protein